MLTTKLVFPIWQSPNKLIFKVTKSESVLYSLHVAVSNDPKPVSIASGGGEDGRRVSRRYLIGLPIEQARILSQMNWKNCRKTDARSNMLHLILTWTIFRQSCVIFSWMILAMKMDQHLCLKLFHSLVYTCLCFWLCLVFFN